MYCSSCGKEKTKVFSGIYCIKTGDKIYEEECIRCNKVSMIGTIIFLLLIILFIIGLAFCN